MTSFHISGLLFDCDGVLVDSDASVLSAWSRWAATYGLDPLAVSTMVHERRSSETVRSRLPVDQAEQALSLIDRYEIEDAASVTALPGAVAMLASLKVAPWAVVTSSVAPLARARLGAAGLPEPSVLVTADMVAKGKPAPDGYLAAAVRLGLPPRECAVFEDAASGVQAARRAGVGVVIGIGPRSRSLDVDASIDDLSHAHYADGTLHTQ